jgi:hypothetical protein
MVIEALQATVLESDAMKLVAAHVDTGALFTNLTLTFQADGVHVDGVYHQAIPIFGGTIPINVSTTWSVAARNGMLAIDLAHLSAGSLPLGLLKGQVINAIQRATQGNAGIAVNNASILVDPDALLLAQGYTVNTNLAGVAVISGALTVFCQKKQPPADSATA